MSNNQDEPIRYGETPYEFIFGAAYVERAISHKGSVVLTVSTPRQYMTIRVTPTGLIRHDIKKITPPKTINVDGDK